MSAPGHEETDLIALALAEDLGIGGDVTSRAFIPKNSLSRASVVARCNCVVSGIETAAEVFRRVDPALSISLLRAEGDSITNGSALMEVYGSTRSILSAERTALNFLGRLCGIATLSRRYADAVAGTRVKLLDTRKTTPGWRMLEKKAVKAGGCANHRMGLHDAVLVKDNHLASLGNPHLLQPIITRLRSEHPGLPIEIEADTLEQVEIFLTMEGINVILLDNMSADQLRRAVELRDCRAKNVQLEASGGITLESLPKIAKAGVDRISVGALTHSSQNADLSLELANGS